MSTSSFVGRAGAMVQVSKKVDFLRRLDSR